MHHSLQSDDNNMVLHETEGQAGKEQSSATGKGVESQLGRLEVRRMARKTSDSDDHVGEDDGDKGEVEAVEEGGHVELDPVFSRGGELVQECSRKRSIDQQLSSKEEEEKTNLIEDQSCSEYQKRSFVDVDPFQIVLLDANDEGEEEEDEVDELDKIPPKRDLESAVVEPSSVPGVVSEEVEASEGGER